MSIEHAEAQPILAVVESTADTAERTALNDWIAEHGIKDFPTLTEGVIFQATESLTPEQKRQAMVADIGRQVRAEFGEPHAGKNNMTDALRAEQAARRGAELAIQQINQQSD
ncbi:MAG: hypothetical protein JWO41_748 [Candidatus Saccharibacteria bacterium]|nr:hypothetical protein [Candidatus Saccharibacteria bacterium]